jgi:uncharacterized protein YjbJ (UPF0337 family)
MSDGNKEKMAGAVDKAKGKAKDAYGGLTNDKSKQAEGKFDKVKGSFKHKAGDEKNKNDR